MIEKARQNVCVCVCVYMFEFFHLSMSKPLRSFMFGCSYWRPLHCSLTSALHTECNWQMQWRELCARQSLANITLSTHPRFTIFMPFHQMVEANNQNIHDTVAIVVCVFDALSAVYCCIAVLHFSPDELSLGLANFGIGAYSQRPTDPHRFPWLLGRSRSRTKLATAAAA